MSAEDPDQAIEEVRLLCLDALTGWHRPGLTAADLAQAILGIIGTGQHAMPSVSDQPDIGDHVGLLSDITEARANEMFAARLRERMASDRKLLNRLAEAELARGAQPQVTAAPHLQAECTHDRHLGGEDRCPIYDRTQTDTDHVFVSQPYTRTCFWRPVGGGGRCEHLLESSVHRGSPFRFPDVVELGPEYYRSPTPACCPNTGAGHELDCPNRP